MTKTFLAKYIPAPELKEVVVQLLNSKFKEELDEIAIKDIGLVWNISETPPHYQAKICLVPEYVQVLGFFPLVIIVWKEGYDKSGLGKRNLLLFHELMHIKKRDNGTYCLKRHDIEDFRSILKKVGVDWEKAEQEFSNLEKEN